MPVKSSSGCIFLMRIGMKTLHDWKIRSVTIYIKVTIEKKQGMYFFKVWIWMKLSTYTSGKFVEIYIKLTVSLGDNWKIEGNVFFFRFRMKIFMIGKFVWWQFILWWQFPEVIIFWGDNFLRWQLSKVTIILGDNYMSDNLV